MRTLLPVAALLLAAGCQATTPATDATVLDVGDASNMSTASVEGEYVPRYVKPAEDVSPTSGADYVTHVVGPGDTFYGLARTYLGDGNRWRDVAAINPAVDRDDLRLGAVVRIPAE